MLEADFVKKILNYEPASGNFTWNVRDDVPKSWNTKYAGKPAGSVDAYGYIVLRINARTYKAHRIAWLYIAGEAPSDNFEIDHKNGVRSDNSIANLRLANDQQNAVNAKARCDNRSGAKGVSWHRRIRKWQAQINDGGKRKSLGYFDTVSAARQAYNRRALSLHQEFVRL